MTTFNFKKWNTILGWFVFAIALITYTLTVEPSLSFWDCGEYIATAAKLEVGHPPGAPLFQMIGAFFAMFAPDAGKVALMVNMTSVFSSAFSILFMFWSMTIILKKLVTTFSTKDGQPDEFTKENAIVVLGSALVGSLAFTFSDSFWFSATEAEVYAMASLFIALLLWLGLRWEEEMHTPKGNKWLLLICLVIGLSFGVHFMALLTIPSLGLLYYFKNYEKITVKNFIIANVVMVAVLFFIFKYLLPYTLAFFGKTEIFMVNDIGLPFNSGTIFALLLIIAFFYFGLQYTKKKELPFYNTILLCILFVLIGFSTWLMLPIRANANVVINENKPSDAAEVLAYYNREQYGEQKTFYGPLFSETYAGLDEENPYEDDKPNYERDYKTGKYVIVNNYKNAKSNPSDLHNGFMPRMWYGDSADARVNYMTFTQPLSFTINPEYSHEDELVQIVSEFRSAFAAGKIDLDGYDKFLKSYGDYLIIEKPSFADNMKFMFEYQFGYMYWRYLLWNFVGRQNDVQGKYDSQNGNWLSGINFIDEMHLGNQENLPPDIENNKARNTYYFLPFILAIIGMVFHAKKDLKSFYILLALFLFTSFALKIFLNERPFEPRERDYAVVGSFYVFAMWLGFGVYAIYDAAKKYLQPKVAGPIIIAVCVLAAPVLMAKENWDDHNRSGRYTAIAMAKAYLDSCEPNAILFTIGDNDTFPLWYAQEIEGYRTDVRIVNTQLFATDWYIDQMKAKTYNSEPLPIRFTHNQYVSGTRDYVIHRELTKERIPIDQFLKFIESEDERTIETMPNGQKVQFFPTDKISIPVDKSAVIKNKIVPASLNDSIVGSIDVDIKGGVIYKNRLMMLDVVANNNWKRPIYFSPGSFDDEDYIWMKEYLQLEGMVYRLVPVKTSMEKQENQFEMGYVDTEKMYKNVMSWDWGNGESPDIYHDPETRKNSISYRTNLARLTEALINEGKKDKAKKVIDLAMTKMPVDYFDYYRFVDPFAAAYYAVGEKTKARNVLTQLMKKYQENLMHYSTLKQSEQNDLYVDIVTDIESYRSLLTIMKEQGDEAFYNQNRTKFNGYNKLFAIFERDME